MATNKTRSQRSRQTGAAILIAIFALVLIAGIAASLILTAGTETAIAGNYRTSTQSFYGAYAGLEEGRGRMKSSSPNPLGVMLPSPMGVNQVVYILNPSVGEVVNPTNLVASNLYRDTEYATEFGSPVTGATVLTTTSVSANMVTGVPGPIYKWVRITAKTERSAGMDVNGDGLLNTVTPIYYDGTNQNLLNIGKQVYRVTALAVTPSGSRRILQYEVAMKSFNLSFPSALTFDGSGSALFPANSNVYTVTGADGGTCGSPLQPTLPAVGVVTPGDDTNITNDIPANRWNNYTGAGPAPDVENISATMPANLQTVNSLDKTITNITNNADYVVTGPATSLPSYGSPGNPVTVVVNGNLTLSGSITGYGILVVTGDYWAQGTVGWRGIVLIVGTGNMTVSGGGSNTYDGAVLLAHTRGPSGNLLPSLGSTLLDWAGGGGNGVHYNSCNINSANSNGTYKILSFREVSE